MTNSRRNFISHSATGIFGFFAVPTPLKFSDYEIYNQDENKVYQHYPSSTPQAIRAVVGAAHARYDKVKELVTARPELAKATWDWGFGDVESALGAASHMGRKDIAEYLMENGARVNIFTLAMLGKIKAVKAIIEDVPGIQKIRGPHGFTLMHHAKIRLMRKNVEGEEKTNQEELVEYLTQLGGADVRAKSLKVSEKDQKIYMGKYTFGEGEDEYFEVKLNMQKTLAMGRGKQFGRTLLRIDEHTFAPGGAPSVKIQFEVKDGVAQSVTVHDPTPVVIAKKIE